MSDDQKQNKLSSILIGTPVGIGLILFGLLIGHSIKEARMMDRFVTVKGLAERDVDADLAIWPIGFKDAAPDLTVLYQKLNQKNGAVVEFLKERGFSDEEIILPSPTIVDSQAEGYSQPQGPRYKAKSVVTVRSTQVASVNLAMRDTPLLVKKGIAIFQEDWTNRPEFLFTQLNNIKPAMIEEATKNAREAAAKFAKDSNSEVGDIRRAYQGLFSIDEIDKSSPHLKKVRVVTTVDFFLK